MKATICIPTTRTSDTLNDCLESLANQTNKDFNILLITRDKLEKAPSSMPRLSIIQQTRPGLIGAMNDALDHVDTEHLIRIDDDVTVTPAWYETILQTFKDPSVGGVTGPTVIPDDELQSRDVIRVLTGLEKTKNIILLPLRWLYLDYLYEGKLRAVSSFLRSGVFTLGSNFKESTQLKKPLEVDYGEACNYAYRTKLLKEIGGFDEYYTRGLSEYNEPDVAYKIRALGYKILFHPKVAVDHHIGNGTAASRGEATYRIRNWIHFYKKYVFDGTPDAALRFAVHIVLQNTYYCYKFLTTGKVDNLGAVVGTFLGLFS